MPGSQDDKVLVVFGPIDPVIRQALTTAFAGRAMVRESRKSTLPDLIVEAQSLHATAVVVPRNLVEERPGESLPQVLVVGISTGSPEIILRETRTTLILNPSPELIVERVVRYLEQND